VVESQLIGIAIIAVILSVVSAFYYVRIIRWMYFEDQVDVTQTITRVSAWGSIILGITTWAIISLFIYPTSLYTVFSSILPYTTTLLLV
jgi:NADH-quinone oxidoreductase subunit N